MTWAVCVSLQCLYFLVENSYYAGYSLMTNIFSVVSLHRNSILNSNDCWYLYNVIMCNKWIFICAPPVSSFSRPVTSDSLTAWTAAHQASLSLTTSQCSSKFSGDAMQPSSDASSPSALNLSQHQGLFQWVSCLHQVTKILEHQLQHQFFQWVFRVDFL